ncbi:hypothetical protein MMC31_000659 [Peltigera leucophlebia]|nr:hypothetical protein [Peltigera leucophlebia]
MRSERKANSGVQLKDYIYAIADCNRALALEPTYTKAIKTRAKAMGESGDWEATAELELKKSKRKDFYKITGVEKDASEKDIKKAYRKPAIVHHLYKNPVDEDAEKSGEDQIDPSDMVDGGAGEYSGDMPATKEFRKTQDVAPTLDHRDFFQRQNPSVGAEADPSANRRNHHFCIRRLYHYRGCFTISAKIPWFQDKSAASH